MQKARKAFTLVELLVVVGIIAVLIALLLPALNKVRQQANAVACLSNLRQVATVMIMYANDNNGCMPGVMFGNYNACQPYSSRLGMGGGFLVGYPNTNGGYYNSLGLLCYLRYASWGPAFFCPGRVANDPLSWESQYKPMEANLAATSPTDWNPGWHQGGFGWIDAEGGYLLATSNCTQDRSIDFSKANRLGKAPSDTPLAMDYFFYGEGATAEGHGQGYNIATFDGSAAFYPDPGVTPVGTHVTVERMFSNNTCYIAGGAPSPPVNVGPDVVGGLNPSTSRWDYWFGLDSGWPSGMPYIEHVLLGWPWQKIKSVTP